LHDINYDANGPSSVQARFRQSNGPEYPRTAAQPRRY
jgi:hypothetical protein